MSDASTHRGSGAKISALDVCRRELVGRPIFPGGASDAAQLAYRRWWPYLTRNRSSPDAKAATVTAGGGLSVYRTVYRTILQACAEALFGIPKIVHTGVVQRQGRRSPKPVTRVRVLPPVRGPFVGTMVENSTADTTSDAGRDRLPAPAGVSSWPRIASRYERVGSVMDTCRFESCRGLFAGVVQR
jgi:hypothetical protein